MRPWAGCPVAGGGGHGADAPLRLLNSDLLLFPKAEFHVSGHRRLERFVPRSLAGQRFK